MNLSLFKRRRHEFLNHLEEGAVAIFSSAPVRRRNGDVEYEYRQDSDFYFLTGLEEPESFCLLIRGKSKNEYILFVRPRDREREIWTGERTGIEGAMEQYGADAAFPIEKLQELLPEFLQNTPILYYTLNKYPEIDTILFRAMEAVRQLHRSGVYPPSVIADPQEILSEMRLVKTPEDVQILQKAVQISCEGHIAAMKATSPGKYEYEIQSVLEYVFRLRGSPRNGYPSIVGSGPNTCTLHYHKNDRKMEEGDLLLIDAGAEYGYYTGDITRTYPVSGRFTAEQRALYEVVLSAQKKAIEAARPENTFMDLHDICVRSLTEGLIHLGLLTGSLEENIEEEHYKKYFMHRTGHWLGMDVHDAGRYKIGEHWRLLQEGMVLTVEPGIYVAADDDHERFRNIGIRIEDDVLITAEGPRVLSSACPKEIPELEALIGTNNLSF